MVVSLGPGRFYGSGLPRPWFHAGVRFSEERVDPPPPVLDPLLRWARDAHWSMGGVSFQRHRLQGRIQGSIKQLRSEAERSAKQQSRHDAETRKRKLLAEIDADDGDDGGKPSPRRLRQRPLTIVDDDEGSSSESDQVEETAKHQVTLEEEPSSRPRRKSVRKLGDEFDRVAARSTQEEVAPGSDVPLPTRAVMTGDASSPRSRARKPIKEGIQIPDLHQSEGPPEKPKAKKEEQVVTATSPPVGSGVSPRRSSRLSRSPRS
uniref:Histone-lysine N-methyltransferase, H3 lysine-36 specific n=1 Tax=Anthurium amnicola TaxID=1678845 RepID=A0A1D1YRJ7_9ARAE